MQQSEFCGLIHRLLATWYWSDQKVIVDRRVKKIVREPKWSRVLI